MKGHFEFKGWTIFPDKICAITDIQYDSSIDGSHTITISYFDE
jgi:hypothetical protein